jgi:hypothetical protein
MPRCKDPHGAATPSRIKNISPKILEDSTLEDCLAHSADRHAPSIVCQETDLAVCEGSSIGGFTCLVYLPPSCQNSPLEYSLIRSENRHEPSIVCQETDHTVCEESLDTVWGIYWTLCEGSIGRKDSPLKYILVRSADQHRPSIVCQETDPAEEGAVWEIYWKKMLTIGILPCPVRRPTRAVDRL